MSNRFKAIEFDRHSIEHSAKIQEKMEEVDNLIGALKEGRAKAVALTHLETAMLWANKAVAEDQKARKAV